MTQRKQTTTGEVISSVIFAGGGFVLLAGAFDPERTALARVVLVFGGIGGLVAAGRFAIAALIAGWR